MLNFINKSVPVEKFLSSAEIKFFNFDSGSSREFPNVSRPFRDREPASPECRYWAGTGKMMFPNARYREFPEFFREISGSREMAFGNADLYSEQWCERKKRGRAIKWVFQWRSSKLETFTVSRKMGVNSAEKSEQIIDLDHSYTIKSLHFQCRKKLLLFFCSFLENVFLFSFLENVFVMQILRFWERHVTNRKIYFFWKIVSIQFNSLKQQRTRNIRKT